MDANGPDPRPEANDEPRDALVTRCLEIGLSPEDIAEAGDDLLDRAVQHILGRGDEVLSLDDVAARTDLEAARVAEIAKATGLTYTPAAGTPFSEEDVALVATVGLAFDLLGEKAALGLVRVASASVTRMGDAAMSAFLTGIGAEASRDESGVELVEANLLAVELMPLFGDALTQMLLRYLRRSYRPRSEVSINRVLSEAVDTRHLTIGFADLVGSTNVADRATLVELSAALDTFERTATDLIHQAGGHVVKFIGDEVMFRTPTSDVACSLAFELVAFARSEALVPALRVGMAEGEVLIREGDYYGPVVNLAARLTQLAPANAVYTTTGTVGSLSDTAGLALDHLGGITIDGFADPVDLVALSPAAEGSAERHPDADR